jgi:hypothetical protein
MQAEQCIQDLAVIDGVGANLLVATAQPGLASV